MCESRPSQGQAEPLCYPLLPCVPPGFFPAFSFLRFFCFFFFFFFFLNAAQAFQICAPPPGSSSSSSCSQPPRENKNRLKDSHHLLLSELLTMQIPSLSSSALPSLSLLSPPSLPPTLSLLLLGKSALIFSLSPPLLSPFL